MDVRPLLVVSLAALGACWSSTSAAPVHSEPPAPSVAPSRAIHPTHHDDRVEGPPVEDPVALARELRTSLGALEKYWDRPVVFTNMDLGTSQTSCEGAGAAFATAWPVLLTDSSRGAVACSVDRRDPAVVTCLQDFTLHSTRTALLLAFRFDEGWHLFSAMAGLFEPSRLQPIVAQMQQQLANPQCP